MVLFGALLRRRSSEVEQGTHKPWVGGSIPPVGTSRNDVRKSPDVVPFLCHASAPKLVFWPLSARLEPFAGRSAAAVGEEGDHAGFFNERRPKGADAAATVC